MTPRTTPVFKSFNQLMLEAAERNKQEKPKKAKKATQKQLANLVAAFAARRVA